MDIVYMNHGGVFGRDAWRWMEGFKKECEYRIPYVSVRLVRYIV